MDGVISQYNKQYLHTLMQYNNALKTTKCFVKSEFPVDDALYEIWEEQMFSAVHISMSSAKLYC